MDSHIFNLASSRVWQLGPSNSDSVIRIWAAQKLFATGKSNCCFFIICNSSGDASMPRPNVNDPGRVALFEAIRSWMYDIRQ